jgi:uridine kinase
MYTGPLPRPCTNHGTRAIVSEMPTLIGIAGLSGSGKTTLARALASQLPSAAVFPLDAYYRPLGHLTFEERKDVNFDHPDALDWPLAVGHLLALQAGIAVETPVYNFATHTREPHTLRQTPADCILVEGLLALWHAELRNLLALKVFVDAPAELCRDRRLNRDVVERRRNYEEVLDQWYKTVHPMAEQFILPSRVSADLIIDGRDVTGLGLARALAELDCESVLST